jgi:hypothetical protein
MSRLHRQAEREATAVYVNSSKKTLIKVNFVLSCVNPHDVGARKANLRQHDNLFSICISCVMVHLSEKAIVCCEREKGRVILEQCRVEFC